MLSSVRNCLPSKELLNDLYTRFVSNAPDEDKHSFEKIMFLVESAHWHYEDNVAENDQALKSLSLREFTSLLFNNCDVLKPYIAQIDRIFRDFNTCKFRCPVSGAIILDETYERCLLVKGWEKTSRWSFPGGKKSKDEEDHACAIREVLEETGFDVSKLLKREEYIEIMVRGQKRVRLYIVGGVREDTAFAPQTKKEISEIAWHPLHDHRAAGLKSDVVAPFLASLKSWIAKHPAPVARRPDMPLKPALSVWSAKTSILGSYNEKPKLDHPKDTGSILGSYRNFNTGGGKWNTTGNYKKTQLDHPKDTGSILGSYCNFNNGGRNRTCYYKMPQLNHPKDTGSILGSYYKANTSAVLPVESCF